MSGRVAPSLSDKKKKNETTHRPLGSDVSAEIRMEQKEKKTKI